MPNLSDFTTDQLRDELAHRERIEREKLAQNAKKFREHLQACSEKVKAWPDWKKKI